MQRYHRKVITVRAEDSPNVQLALAEIAMGLTPSNKEIVPGVIRWENGAKGYAYWRKFWDPMRQAIGLDGQFYKGAEILLYPLPWVRRGERMADYSGSARRQGKGMGVDPAEGGDYSAWSIVDEVGLIHLHREKTPHTLVVVDRTVDLMREYGVTPDRVVFDRSCGLTHAERLRAKGFKGIRTVGFGETVALEPRRGLTMIRERQEVREDRYAYKNKRAMMYWELRFLLDPEGDPDDENNKRRTFALPRRLLEDRIDGSAGLRRQLLAIPLLMDRDQRYYILPKRKGDDQPEGGTQKSLMEILGCSPDELDSLVLAVHGMLHRAPVAKASAR